MAIYIDHNADDVHEGLGISEQRWEEITDRLIEIRNTSGSHLKSIEAIESEFEGNEFVFALYSFAFASGRMHEVDRLTHLN